MPHADSHALGPEVEYTFASAKLSSRTFADAIVSRCASAGVPARTGWKHRATDRLKGTSLFSRKNVSRPFQSPIFITTLNLAFPLIIRSYASAAWSRR